MTLFRRFLYPEFVYTICDTHIPLAVTYRCNFGFRLSSYLTRYLLQELILIGVVSHDFQLFVFLKPIYYFIYVGHFFG